MVGVTQKAIQAWRRFPVALLLAVIAAVALTREVWFHSYISDEDWRGLLLASWALMAFCWGVCGHLWAERLPHPWQRRMVPLLVVAATALVWWLGGDSGDVARRWDSFGVIGTVGFLCLLALPLLTPPDGRVLRTRRWLYGLAKAIILSFLVALMVFIGLGIQLYLLEILFGVYLRDDVFPLMIFCQMVVAPWCALALAPNLWRAEETVPPAALAAKILVRYVLAGLLVLYSVTLNVYCLYVLVSGQWPEGAIAGQVMALACLGGLVWTLLYAVQEDIPGWLEKLVLVGFWPSLLAPAVALFVATGLRIEQYGVTEPRYYLLLGGGLVGLGIAVQVLCRRVPNPSVLAGLVMVVLPLSLFGPWSAESVSVSSQFQRLVTTLDRMGLLGPDGKINGSSAVVVTPADHDSLLAMVRFLTQRKAEDRLYALLEHPDLYAAAVDGKDDRDRTRAFMDLLSGLEITKPPRVVWHRLELLRDDTALSVRGYDFMATGALTEGQRIVEVSIPSREEKLWLEVLDQGRIRIMVNDAEAAVINLTPAVKAYRDQSPLCGGYICALSPPLMFDFVMPNGMNARLVVTGLRGDYVPDAGDGTWRRMERIGFVLLMKEMS